MIKLEPNKMQKAIERAKAVRPRVTVLSADERIYSVTGSRGGAYTVKFMVKNGLKLAECNCAAGRQEMMCFHVASAAQVNVMVQSMRKAAPPADERAELIADIKATWSRRFPGESLADNLMSRFRVNTLALLNVDFLRRILDVIA